MKKSPAAIACAVLFLSSCSTTILSDLASTSTSSVVTTTTIPAGTVRSLLDDLLTNASGLGDLIVSGDKYGSRLRLQNTEAIWIALRPQLVALANDTDVDVERIVDLVRSAVNKKRPADADKAVRFLPLVISALG